MSYTTIGKCSPAVSAERREKLMNYVIERYRPLVNSIEYDLVTSQLKINMKSKPQSYWCTDGHVVAEEFYRGDYTATVKVYDNVKSKLEADVKSWGLSLPEKSGENEAPVVEDSASALAKLIIGLVTGTNGEPESIVQKIFAPSVPVAESNLQKPPVIRESVSVNAKTSRPEVKPAPPTEKAPEPVLSGIDEVLERSVLELKQRLANSKENLNSEVDRFIAEVVVPMINKMKSRREVISIGDAVSGPEFATRLIRKLNASGVAAMLNDNNTKLTLWIN